LLLWWLLLDARSAKLGPLLAVLAALLLATAGPSVARAAPPDALTAPRKTRIRVRYEAPEGCRSSAGFAADLQRRTPRIEVVETADADVLAFHAHIESSPRGFVGTLSLEGEERSEPRRHRADTCADVAGAIAFTLALSIDPDARADVPAEPAPVPTPPAVAPPSRAAPPVTVDGVDRAAERAAPAATRPGSRRLAIGLGPSVVAGLFDVPLLGAVATVESLPGAGAGKVSVRGRIALAGAASRPAAREADVSSALVAAELCPTAFELGAATLRPCGGLALGVAHAVAVNVAQPAEGNALLVAASLRGVIDLPLGKTFGLGFEAAASATLVRPRFYLDPPDRVAAEAGPAAAEVGMAMWARFP
jgi:hypothetical protein